MDEEFEEVAAQVLNRTCAMVNKYRRLLMVEAEVGVSSRPRRGLTRSDLMLRPSPQRSSPSSEMVMIERTFNTEERRKLTQDKRLVLVDPGKTQTEPRCTAAANLRLFSATDSFLEDFCCGMKSKLFQDAPPPQPLSSGSSSSPEQRCAETAYRTDSVPGYGDPGGGGAADKAQPSLTEHREVVDAKRAQQHYGPSGTSSALRQGNRSPVAAGEETHYQGSSHHAPLSSPSQPDTDSALEAAVNSILEC